MSRYAEVIVTLPVEGRFHYAIPPGMQSELQVGHRVLVPFGRRKATAFVTAITETIDFEGSIKKISELLDAKPLVTADLLSIAEFASDYYLATPGEILKAALPPKVTGASQARLRITDEGRRALGGARILSTPEREILQSAAKPKGIALKAVKRSLSQGLMSLGLVQRSDDLETKSPTPQVQMVRRAAPDDASTTKKLARAPAQRRVFERLIKGEVPLLTLDSSGRRAARQLEKRGLAEIRTVERDVATAIWGDDTRGVELTMQQTEVLEPILASIEESSAQAFLLKGVTGSGKTEVYLKAIEAARKKGRGAIVLVPEIALTSQLEARFRERFFDDVVVLHSAMTDKARRERWHRLQRGQARIALGPRSAVWAPVPELGIVVVDEEHDPSFKQNSDVRYNGRDLAILRAHRAKAVLVLGSATPSLEMRHHAAQGKLTQLLLTERVKKRPMPEVETIDLTRAVRDFQGEAPLITRPLADALIEVVGRDEQAIVFLNRRGFNTVVVCDECGEPRRCESCDVSLTHHKRVGRLVCHYCEYWEPFDLECRSCGDRAMKPYGAGTERIATTIAELIPDAKVARLDRDVTSRAGALEETLEAFRSGESDILVGTQMVAKGHDFPRVTLVGIICADASLAFPDFRAAERTFQLVTQVAGRAGRAERPGRVIIQTFAPDHYALQCAIKHDDDRFSEIELAARERTDYPPYRRLGLVRIEGDDEAATRQTAARVADIARSLPQSDLHVMGPAPAPIERIRGRWRHLVMLRAVRPAQLVQAMRQVKQKLDKTSQNLGIVFDIDAYDLL